MESITVETIESIADLENVALDWENKFFEPGLGYPLIWYRGQSDSWDAQPGIFRDKCLYSCDNSESTKNRNQQLWDRERTINRQFRRMSSLLGTYNMDIVSLYFLAQHHGLPTRLLDWTTNPLTALYFAVASSEDTDGVIYCMNTKDLSIPLEMHHPKVKTVVESIYGDCDVPCDATIIPILPDLNSERMLQQSACFTLHTPPMPNNLEESDSFFKPQVINIANKYTVPKAAKLKLRITLRRMGVTAYKLFPDLDHLASELKDAWKI